MSIPAMEGKRVLVIGASQGIGKAAALEFTAQGAHVVVGSRSRDKLEGVVREMAAGKGHLVTLDMSDLEQCKAAVDDAVKVLGGLDVLVVCGGAGDDEALQNIWDPASYESLYRLHVTSALALSNAAIPHLRASKGVIVNVSSAAATIAIPFAPAYCVAKAAQNMLTKCLALELGPAGVRVVAVAPGAIATPMLEKMFLHNGLAILGKAFADATPEDHKKAVAAGRKASGDTHVLQRVGEEEEAAKTIVFLASPGAGFITGAILPVDGGVTITSWYAPKPSS